jgi:SAM-dependent methyltransferase
VLLDQIVRCRACSLVYVNPRLDSKLILDGYSDAEDPVFAAQNDARIRTFRKTFGGVVRRLNVSAAGKRLLDVGCAGGAFLVAARDLGFEATGVEPSRWMADFGRRTYGLDIRDGVLESNMFPERSFDVITLWDVIEHMLQPAQALKVIRALLKPDGYLVVNYPDVGSLAARMLGAHWPFWLSVHLIYYTRKTMMEQLRRAGFTPLWCRPYWQSLPLGYVARRAAPYFRLLGALPRVVDWLHLSKIDFTYNMGQTLVVARRDQ